MDTPPSRPWHSVGPLGVNSDLQKERDTATFNYEEVACILYGGRTALDRRRTIISKIFQDEIFDPKDVFYLSRSEFYEACIKKSLRLSVLGSKLGWTKEDYETADTVLRREVAFSVHTGMFIPTIERLATEEQNSRWLMPAQMLKIIGTYAQTEIAHGTNLRELQTTATYDAQTEEFVLNTNSVTGMKWWPGGLGKTCNHVMLLAKLIIGSRPCGLQAFMVQIRDMDTHKPLKGIEVGSIGPTMGLMLADNGFLILHKVRIPRTNMLMRYNQVSPDGQFTSSNMGLYATYSTMVTIRAIIVEHSFYFITQAAIVATRYSAVRRQSEFQPGAGEVQVLDFQAQQYKLFPNIALAYAMYFASKYIKDTHDLLYMSEFSKGNYANTSELHNQSCCLKAYSTEMTCEGISILRRACGGNGFLMSSGVADIFIDVQASVTYEGENTVLYLQSARSLMKALQKGRNGEPLPTSTAYLGVPFHAVPIHTPEDCTNIQLLIETFKMRALSMVKKAGDLLQTALEAGKETHIAWDENAVNLVAAAKAHVDSFVVILFLSSVEGLTASPDTKQVLRALARLFALNRIVQNSGEFLTGGVFGPQQINMIQREECRLLPQIRPNAVALVDGFDFHDMMMRSSTLGSYDGQCYHRLLEHAKRSPLNLKDVHPAYSKYVKPFQRENASAKL